MDYNTRAYRFVRATEVHPFTKEHQYEYKTIVKAMLEQFHIIHDAQPKNLEDKVVIIENIYKFIMEYPEVLAKHPKYRGVLVNKMYELEDEMLEHNLGKSLVFNDVKYYMKMLSARPDYIESTTQTDFIKPCIETPTHSYNLRTRDPNVQYVF